MYRIDREAGSIGKGVQKMEIGTEFEDRVWNSDGILEGHVEVPSGVELQLSRAASVFDGERVRDPGGNSVGRVLPHRRWQLCGRPQISRRRVYRGRGG